MNEHIPTPEELVIALMRAANEAYHNEVELRRAEPILIGPSHPFPDKQAWLDKRIEEWLGGDKPRTIAFFGPGARITIRKPGEPERLGTVADTASPIPEGMVCCIVPSISGGTLGTELVPVQHIFPR